MKVTRKETNELRDYASLYFRFDYDDPNIETWITMPDVLAIRWENGKMVYFYAYGEPISIVFDPSNLDQSEMARIVGERIGHWIRVKGYTRKEFCEKTGLYQASLTNYIYGRSLPGSYNLYRIAEALDISLDDLVVFDHDINEYVD